MKTSLWHTIIGLIAVLSAFTSCQYPAPVVTDDMSAETIDSLTYLHDYHFTLDTNFEVIADSINLECFPLQDCRNMVRRGQRVVVAEFAADTLRPRDSVLVKLAHSQEVQGWVYLKDIRPNFLPTNDISRAIHIFRETRISYFLVILALFVVAIIVRAFRKKQLRMVYFNDIGSTYPLLLCLLMSVSATLYESMQRFCPETWEHFYYNPTLHPLRVPPILSVQLVCFWLFLVVLITALTEAFRLLKPDAALFYLLGLASALVLCYFVFIYGTRIYVGYACLAGLVVLFIVRTCQMVKASPYRCGKCGHPLSAKGVCPHCGATNT